MSVLSDLARERTLAMRYTHWLAIAKAYEQANVYSGTEPWTVLSDLEGRMDPVLASACASKILHLLPEFSPEWSDVVAIAKRVYPHITDWRMYAVSRISDPSWYTSTPAWWVHGTFPTLAVASWVLTAPHTYTAGLARDAIRLVAECARAQYQPYDDGAQFWNYLDQDLEHIQLAIELVTSRLETHQAKARDLARQLGVFDPMFGLPAPYG